MSATNNMRLAVALSVAVVALFGALWVTYGTGAFVLAVAAGTLEDLARGRIEKAKRQVADQQKGLGNGS